jgi:hypothetical protein
MQLKDDVIRFVRQANQEEPGQPLDIVDLACALVSVGHQVKVRQAVGGGQNCFKNLYHEFILVKVWHHVPQEVPSM